MDDNIFIKSATATVKIVAEANVIKEIVNSDFLYSYIPSIEIFKYQNYKGEDAIVFIKKAIKNEIDISYPKAYYTFNVLNVYDIISFIEYILERARQEKNIICIHGAGCVMNNKLITCWGTATGMGKTTLALELSKMGNSFYSDEKILINLKDNKAVGRIKNQYISNNYWKNKYGNLKYYENENLFKEEMCDISLFIQPIICNQKETIWDEWNDEKFFWHLYEESCRKIRGTSRTFFERTYPVVSLDTFELAQERVKLIHDFTKTNKAFYYKGNVQNAMKSIKNYLGSV